MAAAGSQRTDERYDLTRLCDRYDFTGFDTCCAIQEGETAEAWRSKQRRYDLTGERLPYTKRASHSVMPWEALLSCTWIAERTGAAGATPVLTCWGKERVKDRKL